MYSSITSAKVTRILTVTVGLILLFLMIFASSILNWLDVIPRVTKTLLTAFYVCCPAAYVALFSIYKLLSRILSEEIFVEKNVFSMRILSWCCAFVSVVCIVTGFFYIPLWIFGLGAVFMTLILRVLKSVMQKATEIKNENDMTI